MYNTQDNYKQKTKSVATDYRFEITNGLKFESYRIWITIILRFVRLMKQRVSIQVFPLLKQDNQDTTVITIAGTRLAQ